MLAAVISIPFALILALQSFGVYSMILSTLAHAAIINIWNFMAGQSTYKMQLQRIDYKKTKGLMKVGGFQMGTQIIDYLSSKLDIIVIGIYFDVSELGLYNLSKEVVVKFSFVTNAIVNKVLLPVLTSLQNDIARLREMFCKFVRETSLLNALLTSFMFVFADVIVYYFYGEKYIEATYFVRITAICSFLGLSSVPNGLVAIAMKKTDVTFVYTIIRVIMTSVILLTFGWISMEVTMIAVLIVAIIGFFLSWKMLLNNTISLGLLTYLKRFVPSSSTFSIVSIVLMPWWIAYGDYKKISVTVVFVLVYMLVTAICVAFAERDMVKQLITKRYDAYKKQTN
jgi:O-antigen/teichoic acid export membrane protein